MQTLLTCIPGCFRLAQKNFICIDDVALLENKDIRPICLEGPENIDNFYINEVSWQFIKNTVFPNGVPPKEKLKILPIISKNQMIGRITLKDSMEWCNSCENYYPRDSHKCNFKTEIRYMQNPCRVDYTLLPEFKIEKVYEIFKEFYSFSNKDEILEIFKDNVSSFGDLISAITEVDDTDLFDVYSQWNSISNDRILVKKLWKELGPYQDEFIKYIVDNFGGIKYKQISHSARVAENQGDRKYISPKGNLKINYTDDINIIRFVYDLKRYPVGFNLEPKRLSDIKIRFNKHDIQCIAASTKVECLILITDDTIKPIITHTLLHALTIYLSEKFKVSKDIIRHHIDDDYSLIFIDQPINLGLLADVNNETFKDFFTNYLKRCQCPDLGVCPGGCHHCLHFPQYSCPEHEDMGIMKWDDIINLDL